MNEAERQMTRRRAIRILFPRPLQGRRPGRRNEIKEKLEMLQQVVEKESQLKSREYVVQEGATIALCLALINLPRDTSETEVDQLENFTQGKEYLQKYAETDIGRQVLPLFEELIEAGHWKAQSEMVKLRILLTEQSERLVRQWWDRPIDEQVGETDVSMDVEGENESIQSSDNCDAITPASSSPQAQRMSRLVDTASSDDESDSARNAHFSDLSNRLWRSSNSASDEELTGAWPMHDGEMQEDEDDEADSVSEDEDDDSDAAIWETMESNLEDDDDDDDHHGLSGGNAEIVYPTTSFTGHANNETVKDCGFLGSNDEYVWSGSDCGHVFAWDNSDDTNPTLKGLWKGDDSVVNVLAQHPRLPVWACSGIDDSVKVFGPVATGPLLSDRYDMRQDIINGNKQKKS